MHYFLGGWTAHTSDHDNAWIQADLHTLHLLYGVTTQGRNGYDEWTERYMLKYSYDGISFVNVQSVSYSANWDQNTQVTHLMPRNTVLRFLRLYPTQFENAPNTRWNAFGSKYNKVMLCDVFARTLVTRRRVD